FGCQECAGGVLLCQECCVDRHADNLLHVIYRWAGTYFVRTSLCDLMLRIQLGHPPRNRCLNPQAGHSDFVVLHDNSIHQVHINFCDCDQGGHEEPFIQLLCEGWYPATHERPQTVATFQVLDRFHMQTLQAKTTTYDFYTVLERLISNTGVKLPDRYQPFLWMSCQWRHLMMLKWAGRRHNQSGVLGTAAGELALGCPVCPDPKVNLLEGWDNTTPADHCVSYSLLAICLHSLNNNNY
ncbi:hypothetical protein K438DRAFT_1560258, partial [Mycena galopus ATCC 62051]